jgi:hypothetical protein
MDAFKQGDDDALFFQHLCLSLMPGASATPGTLGVSVFLGCSAFRVLYVF